MKHQRGFMYIVRSLFVTPQLNSKEDIEVQRKRQVAAKELTQAARHVAAVVATKSNKQSDDNFIP